MSRAKNLRLAWFSQRLCSGASDALIIAEAVVKFRISATTARKDLTEIYTRWTNIDLDNAHMHKAKFMELGMELMDELRTNMQFGPAVNHFKTLAQISGVLSDGKVRMSEGESSMQPAPKAEVVRDRISQLANDPKVRAKALALGLDLSIIDGVDKK